MKCSLLLTFCGCCLVWQSLAQTPTGSAVAGSSLQLTDLQLPTSPGFTLLDEAPSSIEHPTSSRAFSTSVINSLSQNHGWPQNYAAEFTPFWFLKHESMTALKYWGVTTKDGKTGQDIFSGVQTSTSVTLSYIKKATADSTTNVALGLRIPLIKVYSQSDLDRLKAANDLLAKELSKLALKVAVSLDDKAPDYKAKLEKLLEVYNAAPEIIAAKNELQTILTRKPRFSVDLAGAANEAFMGSDVDHSLLSRAGGWLTANYSAGLNEENIKHLDGSNSDYINLYGTARYLRDRSRRLTDMTVTTDYDLLDLGAKIEFELSRFAVSYEYLRRWAISGSGYGNQYRSSGQFKYRINNSIAFTMSLGKNFGSLHNFISQFGLSFSPTEVVSAAKTEDK